MLRSKGDWHSFGAAELPVCLFVSGVVRGKGVALAMPLAHRPLLRVETLSPVEEREARGEHLLVASGCCGLLHLLLPGLVSTASATVSPSTCEVPLRLAGWLALPLLRLADSVKETPFYTTMVGPERLGAALDAAMAHAGLSSAAKATPLAPTLLRLQLYRAATAYV